MLLGLFQAFDSIKQLSLDFDEDWGFLTFRGKCTDVSQFSALNTLDAEAKSLKINQSITFHIETSTYKSTEDFLENIYNDCSWKVALNKSEYLDILGLSFFYSPFKFIEWSKRISVFEPESIFNKRDKIKIIVNGIDKPFGGPNILVCNATDLISFDEEAYNLPTQAKIKTVIHSTINEDIPLNPINHLITFGSNNDYSSCFFERSAVSLAVCLSSEINTKNSLILRGVRRLDVSIVDSSPKSIIDINLIRALIKAILWVYEERIELRLKLFLDRVTLDIDYTKPYLQGLISVIDSSLQQAKERYSFIIYDRKDEYQKELRELLKDLRNLTELYSLKIRGVLSNLLRDVLATLVLIGFTIFTKTVEIKQLSENQLLTPMFRVFSVYFLLSIAFQAWTDWYDIRKTRREFVYWKKISREYITKTDFENHMNQTVNKRRNGTILIYSILAVAYSLISILCWNFKTIFQYVFS